MVVDVDAELDESSVDDVAQCEDVIVNQSQVALPPGAENDIRQEVDRILSPYGFETRLLVIRHANSLAVYITCLTLSAIMSLRVSWSNGQLKGIVESLFTFLSSATRAVRVKRLNWPLSDYKRCAEFLISVKGEQIV